MFAKQQAVKNNGQVRDLVHETENHRPPPQLQALPALGKTPRVWWSYALNFARLLVQPMELVRQVGPGIPPEPRHVWDKSQSPDLRLPL